ASDGPKIQASPFHPGRSVDLRWASRRLVSSRNGPSTACGQRRSSGTPVTGKKRRADPNECGEKNIVMHGSGQRHKTVADDRSEHQRALAAELLTIQLQETPQQACKHAVKQHESDQSIVVEQIDRRRMRGDSIVVPKRL